MSITEVSIDISEQQLRIFIPIVAGLIAYMIYWFTQESNWLKEKLTSRFGEEDGCIKRVIGTKYLGAITLGLIPFLAYKIAFPETTLRELGIWLNKETVLFSLILIVGLASLMILILFMSSKSPKVLAKQPEIRKAEWPRRLLIYNLLAWAVYLFGYEFFFRGVLLYPLVDSIGLWPAIAVNVLFYSGVHIPKGVGETIGAIIAAVVFCLLNVYTGTIWISYFVHLAMAWTITLAALKHQPNMKIIK